MPHHRTSFARQAASFAANAQREQASLRRDLKTLQDGFAGLQRSIKAPVPSGGSRVNRNKPGKLSVLQSAVQSTLRNVFSSTLSSGTNNVLQGNFGSFYASAQQIGSAYSSLSDLAQRIL